MIKPEMYAMPWSQCPMISPLLLPLITFWRCLMLEPVPNDENILSLSTLKEGGHPFHSCGYHYLFSRSTLAPFKSIAPKKYRPIPKNPFASPPHALIFPRTSLLNPLSLCLLCLPIHSLLFPVCGRHMTSPYDGVNVA